MTKSPKFAIYVKGTDELYEIVDNINDSYALKLPSMAGKFEVVKFVQERVLTDEEVKIAGMVEIRENLK